MPAIMSTRSFWNAFDGADTSIAHTGSCAYCQAQVAQEASVCPRCNAQWRLTFRFFGTRLSYVIMLAFLYLVLKIDPPLSYALIPGVFLLLLATAERKTEWVYRG